MYRSEVVTLMCDTIDNFNRYQAQQQGAPEEQIEEYIKAGREQMEFVNGLLYDTLKEAGVVS